MFDRNKRRSKVRMAMDGLRNIASKAGKPSTWGHAAARGAQEGWQAMKPGMRRWAQGVRRRVRRAKPFLARAGKDVGIGVRHLVAS